MVALVLLGAGASFGSGNTFPENPPLGAHLFSNLERLNGYAATFPVGLKKLFRENFERGMDEFCQLQMDVSKFHRELGSYIVRFVPKEGNVYFRLIDELGAQRVTYCSLNYDLMLEMAAALRGLKISYGLNRPDAKYVRVLKPHGSCNFWLNAPINQISNLRIVNLGGGADIEGGVSALSVEETKARCQYETVVGPAMSMFAVGKEVNVCPSFVMEQRRQWEQIAAEATKIFVVGVRVHQVDEHIWGVLARTKADITYFGISDNDELEFNQWFEPLKKKNCRFIKANFCESVPLMRMRLNGR